jgi:hypothetical protein
VKKTDDWTSRLLRTPNERPCCDRINNSGDKFASPHLLSQDQGGAVTGYETADQIRKLQRAE